MLELHTLPSSYQPNQLSTPPPQARQAPQRDFRVKATGKQGDEKMNPLALLIGVPLGLLLSELVHNAPEIYETCKQCNALAMEHRFGADRRKCEEYAQHEARVDKHGRERRAEFRKRNNTL